MQCRREYYREFVEVGQDRKRDAQRWIFWATKVDRVRADEASQRQRTRFVPRRVSSDADPNHSTAQADGRPTSDAIRSLVCDACWKRLFTQESFREVWFSHSQPSTEGEGCGVVSYSTTRSEVFQSYVAGCQWCTLLERKFGSRLLRLDPRFVHVVHVRTMPTGECMVRRGCNSRMPDGAKNLQITINGITLSYLTYTPSDDNASSYIPARDFVLQVGSSRSTRLAQQCMEQCIRTHAQCPKPQQVELPTRVIDCSDVEKPKLILSGGRRGRYAALSYVWGGPQFCTTTGNIHSLVHEGIDNHALPQTILDAIRTTNSMGIPYLWVDALCILQDSDTDKYTEIGRMRMVYRNAHVTIIAASSAKAVDGFLQDRSAPPHTSLPFRCPDGRLGTFSLLPDAYIESEEAEPVDTRGWCLQERLLSPRALIYTSSTLQFECQMETVNVGGAVCPPSRIQRLPNEIFTSSASENPSGDAPDMRDVWRSVLVDYARREVTNPADKLVAFAGIAEQFQIALGEGDEYLAGLWKRNLSSELLWKRHKRRLRPAPKDSHYAPSWSWAATDGEIMAFDAMAGPKFDIPVSCNLCEVVSCEVMPRSVQAPFGGVVAATLTISARVLPVDRDRRNPRIVDTFHVGSCEQCLAWTESDCREDEFPWSDKAFVPAIIDGADGAQYTTAYSACVEWTDVQGNDCHPTFAIPVGWNEGSPSAKQRMIVGILAKRVHDTNIDGECYRRVGYFETKPGLVWHVHNDPAHRRLITLI
ncbi:hypothetical protein PAXINDRAFT_102159 [Paxillus involutus ATCC 200175]|uniref:Heterokaryon incompatibility domain-containing protein n=1 Tax=Paxillus involutus ATCC 200175 TaxID=664439 RepID=A0A0C9T2B6_PAXIN|nr:hypothetical protein PAXINDRAFT_102159 [Paxillus involutus ATCC 200175]